MKSVTTKISQSCGKSPFKKKKNFRENKQRQTVLLDILNWNEQSTKDKSTHNDLYHMNTRPWNDGALMCNVKSHLSVRLGKGGALLAD